MSNFHTEDAICPGCEKKLETAHPYMAKWFRVFVKPSYPNCHISDSFRNEAQQLKAILDKASEVPWPNSKHNKMARNALGQMVGCSEALDLFQQVDGKPIWNPMFFAALADISTRSGWTIKWGGLFKRWKGGKLVPHPDNPHFEKMEDES